MILHVVCKLNFKYLERKQVGMLETRDYNKIIKRANIQELRSLFLDGVDLESWRKEPDMQNYEERLSKGEKPLIEFVKTCYPDGEKRDVVLDLISEALLANQEVYTELGMKIGARLIYELLLCNPQKGVDYEKSDKKR